MFKLARKWWKYVTAKLTGSFNERADPKVQIEQAIIEAQEQHRRLTQQAANVIANQKQGEMSLNRSLEDLTKVNANARQALLMAADATAKGDAARAQQYNTAAEALANRMIELERSVDDQKALVLQATQASDQAKAAVQQNASNLQRKLAERSKLLSQLDQAKMAEQMNSAMASLNQTVGQDVPTFDEVRQKIEARYAQAKAASELTGTSVESRMMEIEQATANVEAQSRLSQLRTELGLDGGTLAAPAAAPAVEQPKPQA
jgi:phage shock protein A